MAAAGQQKEGAQLNSSFFRFSRTNLYLQGGFGDSK